MCYSGGQTTGKLCFRQDRRESERYPDPACGSLLVLGRRIHLRTALLRAHDQDGAVGVANHRVRYAPHERPPYPPPAPAAHDYQSRAYLPGELQDLLRRPS